MAAHTTAHERIVDEVDAIITGEGAMPLERCEYFLEYVHQF
jgi:hypothetical protein